MFCVSFVFNLSHASSPACNYFKSHLLYLFRLGLTKLYHWVCLLRLRITAPPQARKGACLAKLRETFRVLRDENVCTTRDMITHRCSVHGVFCVRSVGQGRRHVPSFPAKFSRLVSWLSFAFPGTGNWYQPLKGCVDGGHTHPLTFDRFFYLQIFFTRKNTPQISEFPKR